MLAAIALTMEIESPGETYASDTQKIAQLAWGHITSSLRNYDQKFGILIFLDTQEVQ